MRKKKNNPQENTVESEDLDQVATKRYVRDAIAESRDEIINTIITRILLHMPNKDDFVTKAEFNELRKSFGDMQEIILQMNDKLDKQMAFYDKHLYENTRRLDYHDGQITIIKRKIGLQTY